MNNIPPSAKPSNPHQIAVTEIFTFLHTGNIYCDSQLTSDNNLSMDDIRIITDILQDRIGDEFAFDNSLDCCTGFRDFNFVSEHYFGAHKLALMLGDNVRQPWMVAQSCNLWAAIHRRFRFLIHESICEASYSWPCILGNDNRLIIPCSDGLSTYFVLCDEYWAFPCCVYDFKNNRYYSTGSSPVTRDSTNAMRSMLMNIAAWFVLEKKYQAGCGQSVNTAQKPYIYVGGAPNPSHVLWNYIGGIRFAINCIGSQKFDSVVCSTDILFPCPDYGLKIHVLHTYDELERIRMLVESGHGNAVSVKFTDAGLNPEVCLELSSSVVSGLIKPQRSISLDALAFHELLDFPHVGDRPDVVLFSIRSGKRKIANQVYFYLELIKCLLANRDYLWVILDGSSRGGWSQVEQDSKIAKSISAAANTGQNKDNQRLSIRSAIGLSISEQTFCYRFVDTYLTYVSGGNAKIIPFCNCSGVAVGPSSRTVDSAIISLDEAIKMTGLQEKSAINCFDPDDSFLLSHDYQGYSSLIVPPHAILGRPASKDQSGLANTATDEFNLDFELDPHEVRKSLDKCLLYNNSAL